MSTIAQKLSDLAQVKSDIAAAIVAKGVAVDPSDTFASYATKIGQIPTGGGLNPIYSWDFTSGTPLVDTVSGHTAILGGSGATLDSNGLLLSASSFLNLDIPARTYTRLEITVGTMAGSGISGNGVVLAYGDSSGSSTQGLKFNVTSNYWTVWISTWENMNIGSNTSYFENSVISMTLNLDQTITIKKDGTSVYTSSGRMTSTGTHTVLIGGNGKSFTNMLVTSARYYELEH